MSHYDKLNQLIIDNNISTSLINGLSLLSFNSKTYNYNFKFPSKFINKLKEQIFNEINEINFIDYNIEKVSKIGTGFYIIEDNPFISIRFKVNKKQEYLFSFINKNKKLFDFVVLINQNKIFYLYKDIIYKDFESLILINAKNYIPKEIKQEENKNDKEFYKLITLLCY